MCIVFFLYSTAVFKNCEADEFGSNIPGQEHQLQKVKIPAGKKVKIAANLIELSILYSNKYGKVIMLQLRT